MFNYTVEESKCCFRHMPTDVVHPACLPPELPRGIFLRVTNLEGEWLLKAAVRIGSYFTVPQLDKIAEQLRLPELAKGSGAHGSPIKIDKARQLVEHLFKDSESSERKQEMIAGIMNMSTAQLREKERSILEMCEHLDVENQQCFDQMKRWATDKLVKKIRLEGQQSILEKQQKANKFRQRFAASLQLRAKGKGKGKAQHGPPPAPAEANPGPAPAEPETPMMSHREHPPGVVRVVESRRAHVTPPEFKDLLPGGGAYASQFTPFRNDVPGSNYYRVGYKISALDLVAT